MRTNEECYEYVLNRCAELEAQKRKRRETVLKAAAPVCGIAVIAGAAAALRSGKANTGTNVVSDTDLSYSDTISSAYNSANSVIEHAPQYENTLNIGEVEISDGEGAGCAMSAIPATFYEMSRDEVLEHFGLSAELDLSDAVDGLYEIAPKESLFNPEGKHGFPRFYYEDENGNGNWDPMLTRFDNQKFEFESADGESSAVVIFDHEERVSWLLSGMLIHEGNGLYSSQPFYALPPSTVAGVEMRIAKRNIGGYYAEFRTETLSVGLIAEGLSESETVAILEYLAEYTGAADGTSANDVSVSDIDISYPERI